MDAAHQVQNLELSVSFAQLQSLAPDTAQTNPVGKIHFTSACHFIFLRQLQIWSMKVHETSKKIWTAPASTCAPLNDCSESDIYSNIKESQF